ncbi:MYND finger domain [Micractinium conductrix]|uniref:phytol kinase n=1 Tax=Micractinium conductrix TaxID=554055 RepID=A0A2P6VAT7_9CHLO|nr:MYND finger domain [Micractinium conductrix]|eukprot:PSC71178.1 MYND finger domain [Micractinium conductrix]
MWCWQLPHAAFQVAWAACPPLAAQLTAAAEAGQDVWTVVDSVANLPAVDVLASCLIAAAHSQPDSRFAASFADGAEHPLCVIAALLPRLFAGTYGGGMPLSQRRHYDNTLEHMLNALDLLYCPARGLDHEMAGQDAPEFDPAGIQWLIGQARPRWDFVAAGGTIHVSEGEYEWELLVGPCALRTLGHQATSLLKYVEPQGGVHVPELPGVQLVEAWMRLLPKTQELMNAFTTRCIDAGVMSSAATLISVGGLTLMALEQASFLILVMHHVQHASRAAWRAGGYQEPHALKHSLVASYAKAARFWMAEADGPAATEAPPGLYIFLRSCLLKLGDSIINYVLTDRIFDCRSGREPNDSDPRRLLRTWGPYFFLTVPVVADLYAACRQALPADQRPSHILWHAIHHAQLARLEDLLVRAGGGQLFHWWIQDQLESPRSRHWMENGYVPKSVWSITHERPGMALALLTNGGMRLLFERVKRNVRQLAAAGQRGVGSTFSCPCCCGLQQIKEPPLGCAWEVIYCTIELMDSVGATAPDGGAFLPRVIEFMKRQPGATAAAGIERAMIRPGFWQGVMDELVPPLEQMAAARWNESQGLDAEGRPLRGAPPTNLIQLYTAVAACTCCNPACANLEGASEQVLLPELMKCSKCRRARYCSAACQLADWPRHKKACKHMQ